MRQINLILFALLSLGLSNLYANVSLPHLFSDNMVLQRDQPLKIWGQADKGEPVTVKFCGQQVKTKASKNGKWQTALCTSSKQSELFVIKNKRHFFLIQG